MKKLALIIFAFFIFTFNGFSQGCLPEGITFTTQQQIDDFQTDYPGCTEIEGDVEIILNPNINNLNNLEVLTAIGGGLEITGTGLTSLEGLHNLTTIGGNLLFWQNDQLAGFESLENLMSIGGGLEIKNNPQILNLNGFENTSIADYLIIRNNIALNSLAALDNIASVDGGLFIRGNGALQDLSGLNNLNSVEGFLYVDYNDSLLDLSGLDNLVSVGEGFVISSNPSLVDLTGLENLTSLGYGLAINGNSSLVSLNGIQNLVSNEGILVLDDNNDLSDITALENIEPGSITDLFIIDNESLSTCEIQSICDYLVNPNGTITIYGNAPGCNSQSEVEDACWVKVNEASAIGNTVQIFPNPAKNTITILNSSKTKIDEVIIYSPSGQIILQKKTPVNTIDISKLHPGLYFVEVKTEMGHVRKKLIVE